MFNALELFFITCDGIFFQLWIINRSISISSSSSSMVKYNIINVYHRLYMNLCINLCSRYMHAYNRLNEFFILLGCFTLLTATLYSLLYHTRYKRMKLLFFLFKLSRIYHFNKSRLHYIGIILRTYSCVLFFLLCFCSLAVLCDWYTGYIQWENNDLSFITVFVCEIRFAKNDMSF